MPYTSLLTRGQESWPRRLIVVLYADMVGYSRLIGHDDTGTILRLRALRRRVIDPALAANFGILRQTGGDALLVVFDSIDHAVDAALAIQEGTALAEAGRNDPIQYRIGINLGDVVLDDDELYGNGINVAARLQSACPPGQVCVSRAIRDHTRQRRDVCFVPLGPLGLKNIEASVEAFVIAGVRAGGPVRRLLRLAGAIVPAWRVKKAYAVAAAAIPLIAVGVHGYMNSSASQAQREQVAALTAGQRAIAEAVIREKGVPPALVAQILRRLEESAASPSGEGADDVADLLSRLQAKADEFVSLRQQVKQLAGDEPGVSRLRADAEAALGRAELPEAQERLRQAAALEIAAGERLSDRARTHAQEAAGLLERSARVAAVTLHYVDAAGDLGRAAAVVEPFDRPEQWRLTMERAQMLRAQGDEFGDRTALSGALEHYRAALSMVSQAERPLDWARAQDGLGVALRTLGELEWGPERLEQAVLAFQAALEERTRENVPQDWADTQSHLGLTLWRLGERRNGMARLEQAVKAMEAALEVRTRDHDAVAWAWAQDALGMVLVALGRRETGTARLEQALQAALAARDEFALHGHSGDWARAQNNVGVALASLALRDMRLDRLEQAIAAYNEALTVRTRDRAPRYWARTMDNLGIALFRLGLREDGTASLERSVAAFHAALAERRRDQSVRDHASTQENLGNALLVIATRDSDTTRLREAVEAFRDATEEEDRPFEPLRWAFDQHRLGNALTRLGEQEDDPAWFEEAVVSYRKALLERRRDLVPMQWAETQSALGWTLMDLGQREAGTARLEEAVAAERAALDERARDRVPLQWADSQNRLGVALKELGLREGGTERLEEAVAAYKAGLEERPPGGVGFLWTGMRFNLGIVLREMGERRADSGLMEEAVAIHRDIVGDQAFTRSRAQIAFVQNQLGLDLLRLGLREPGTARLEDAETAFAASLSALGPSGRDRVRHRTEEQLAAVQTELAHRRALQK